MTLLPCIIKAEYRGGYRIRVSFNDGSEKTLDFGEWLEGPIFKPLGDLAISRGSSLMGEPLHGQTAPT